MNRCGNCPEPAEGPVLRLGCQEGIIPAHKKHTIKGPCRLCFSLPGQGGGGCPCSFPRSSPTLHGIRLAACQLGLTRAFVCQPPSFSRPLLFPRQADRPTKNTTVPADRFRLFVLTTSASASRRHPLSLLPLTSPHLRHDPRFDRLHVPFGYPLLGQAGIPHSTLLDCKFVCGADCFALISLSRMKCSRYLECCCANVA